MPLQVKNLRLKDYRNYSHLDIDFSDTFNIIYGNNGQGKTNIIEAIFLCAAGRSHRTTKDQELIKYDAEGFDIKLLFKRSGIDKEINISYKNKERKKIFINEIPLRKLGDLMGNLNAVMFSPEDLLIIKQGPAERRRFIDITISQLKPTYFYDLQQYAKVLFQRNILLKGYGGCKGNDISFDVWSRHLVKTGARIMKTRNHFIKRLGRLATGRHAKLTNGEEELRLSYSPSFECGGEKDEEMENVFYDILKKNKGRELQRGTTLYGPHRDDIDIVLNGESNRIYGSQGQQRTSVLAMKLAEIDLVKDETGEYPVLLLDDVLSELDDNRKEYLLENIDGMQNFITCTDIRFFNGSYGASAFYYVEGGKAGNIK